MLGFAVRQRTITLILINLITPRHKGIVKSKFIDEYKCLFNNNSRPRGSQQKVNDRQIVYQRYRTYVVSISQRKTQFPLTSSLPIQQR
ncbi:hypothetical protein PMIT1313_01161 [Prochlorococcus marinus str. MIT 1313]|nr:hypothetical protein PMIT1313_01161 [Prochlorococcus marinus str. MIT 1313]KZR72580.1 hypothetical protein PMIT1318_01094 [Prochlorococcus marinus str. MIT 1318]